MFAHANVTKRRARIAIRIVLNAYRVRDLARAEREGSSGREGGWTRSVEGGKISECSLAEAATTTCTRTMERFREICRERTSAKISGNGR